MTGSVRICGSCQTPLPDTAGFCLNCGEATPTVLSHDTEAGGKRTDANELDYRQRLQRALGKDYELRQLIGQGGFGEVYAAWDKRLEREVAVKALRHDLFPTPAILQRFEREAKAVAKLRQPNILPIYAIGEREGIAYMVMPLVDGQSLRDLLERDGKLPIHEAVRIAADVAKALEAAHQHGYVHRDVKPENIMLEGRDRQVYLMDFGIAKAATTDGTGLTASGVIIGSPSYMSPEQARGEADIDHRADVYALGAVAYEMLTGERPINAANLHELIYRHATDRPKPLGEHLPGVPGQVEVAVMRCLAAERGDRWTDCRDFRDVLLGVGVEGDQLTSVSPLKGFWWTQLGKVVAVFAVLGVLVLGGSFVAGLTQGAREATGDISQVDSAQTTREPLTVVEGDATSRDGMIQEAERAYQSFQSGRATQLLTAALIPHQGSVNETWAQGVHLLAQTIWEEGREEEARVWLRWGRRLFPDMAVDEGRFFREIISASLQARDYVRGQTQPAGLVQLTWQPSAGRGDPSGRGHLSVEPQGLPDGAVVGIGRLNLPVGTRIGLPGGSYTIQVTAPGQTPVAVNLEVLPGVTTIVRFRLP